MLCLNAWFIALLLFWGCAGLPARYPAFVQERPHEAGKFFRQLDETVKRAGVRDVSSALVSGFPYLRSNRFLVSIGQTLTDLLQEKEEWARLLQELDLQARKKEIRNLPDEAIVALGYAKGGKADREGLYSRVESASQSLLSHDRGSADFYPMLSRVVNVPGEYSTARRIAGVYPLVALPVVAATYRAHKQIKAEFAVPLEEIPVSGKLVAYTPRSRDTMLAEELQLLIKQSCENPLRIPLPGEAERETLARSFAPIIVQDTVSSYDAIGQIAWRKKRLMVDTEKPTVYYYLSHNLLRGKPILQINYVFWYPARAGTNAPWIERGTLDGNTIRLSFDTQGELLMVDGMNTCGCYHFFVPRKNRVKRVVPQRFKLDTFVPQWLPSIPPGERLGLRIISGWHQVRRVFSSRSESTAIPYRLAPYEELESLPCGEGRFESMFDAKGIAKHTSRLREEILFFSMGIPSVAAMRQRGNHPIVLAGRAYFDDPLLFDKNFEFK